jgi:hypothetical protein
MLSSVEARCVGLTDALTAQMPLRARGSTGLTVTCLIRR